jgi:hypothetical protein
MSTALAQSATVLTKSETASEYPWATMVESFARLKLGKNPAGVKIEKLNLNYEKLEKQVRNDFRRRFPQLCVGPARDIPSDYNAKLREAVLAFIDKSTVDAFNAATKADPENNCWIGKQVDYKVVKDKDLGNRIVARHQFNGVEELKMNRQADHARLQITWLGRQLDALIEKHKQPECKLDTEAKEKQITRIQNRIDMFSDILRVSEAVAVSK